MFLLYNRSTRARLIPRQLRIPRCYYYEHRTIVPKRANRMTKSVNWGCVRIVFNDPDQVLNADIKTAASKVLTFEAFADAGIPYPTYHLMPERAQSCGKSFLGRKDRLSGGRGITIYQAGDTPAYHEFYTEVINCRREYRIHVFAGAIIAIQKKRIADATSIIHNHDNGVIFQHIPDDLFDIGTKATQQIKELAISSVRAVGVDFGAVDIIQELGTNAFYALEVNTAPGIRTDVIYDAYLKAFTQLMEVS